MRPILAFAVLFTSIISSVTSEARVTYGSLPTVLEGFVSRQDFPGRPNYESIEHGDEKETYWILSLQEPTRFIEAVTDRSYGPLKDLQLVLSSEYQWIVGQKVRVSGTLFNATTAHHKTDLLIEVSTIESAP